MALSEKFLDRNDITFAHPELQDLHAAAAMMDPAVFTRPFDEAIPLEERLAMTRAIEESYKGTPQGSMTLR